MPSKILGFIGTKRRTRKAQRKILNKAVQSRAKYKFKTTGTAGVSLIRQKSRARKSFTTRLRSKNLI